MISDYNGNEYQRIEYTPYGETWVEKTSNTGLEYLPYKFTAKELDEETGLYYYGARYLDPKYSMWLSTDPALGEYIPQAPVNDEAKKNNQNLPGMGGIFNHINGNLYHYAGNNPVKYVDPDGNEAVTASFIGIAFLTLATYYTLLNYYQNPEVQEANRQLADSISMGIESAKESIKNLFNKSKNKDGAEAEPVDEPSALPNEGVDSAKNGKTKAKDRRKQEKEKSKLEKHGDPDWEEPASEEEAKWRAKEMEKHEGKDARRAGHDAKEKGAPDRSKRQLREDYDY